MSAACLRAATPLDAGVVGGILSACIDATPWLPRIHSRAEDLAFAGTMIARGWVTLAETETGPAGFIARDGAKVHALYIDAAARGRGLGRALIEDAKAQSPALELWTFQANTPAQRFYARAGFAEVERTDGAGNDEGLPDIRLIWTRDTERPLP